MTASARHPARPGRQQRSLEDGERAGAPPGGSGAGMGTLAPSAGARAAAKVACDDGEYVPSCAGELIAMSRERVANLKRLSYSNHVTGTARWPAERREWR